ESGFEPLHSVEIEIRNSEIEAGAANSVNGRRTISPRQPPRQRCFGVRISHLILVVLCGCGAPGEPQPPSPPVPAPIADLSARQQGNGVQLTFTLPARSVKAERLTETPAVEIFRAPAKPDGSVDNKSFTLVYTIPGAMAHSYVTQC